jgi:[phosphatase 2A protein]-leucine-carboxy methyltransferase
MAIKKSSELLTVLGDVQLTGGGTGLTSPIYTLHPLDLRNPPETTLAPLLQPFPNTSVSALNPDLPTIFLAECVFVYLPPTATHALINFFTSTFHAPGCAAVIYEMFGLSDAFGRVMKDNLRSRGVEIPGVIEDKEMQSQVARLIKGGMTHGNAVTLKAFRERGIDPREMARLVRSDTPEIMNLYSSQILLNRVP